MRRFIPIQAAIDVARTGDFKTSKSWHAADGCDELFGNFARRLPQGARQLESNRQSIVAHLYLGRLFDRQARILAERASMQAAPRLTLVSQPSKMKGDSHSPA